MVIVIVVVTVLKKGDRGRRAKVAILKAGFMAFILKKLTFLEASARWLFRRACRATECVHMSCWGGSTLFDGGSTHVLSLRVGFSGDRATGWQSPLASQDL